MPTNTYTWGGWAFGPTLENLLNEAKYVHAGVANYAHLGASATMQNTRVSEIVNRQVEALLEANPSLGLTTASVTTTTQSNVVPTTLHATHITRIYYADGSSDASHDLRELTYADPDMIARMDESWRNGETTHDYPQFWGYNITRTSWLLYPTPAASIDLVVEYRPEPTPVTAANVASPAAVTIPELPTPLVKVVALGIAVELREPFGDVKYQTLKQRYEAAMEEAKKLVGYVRAAMRTRQRQYALKTGLTARSKLFNFDLLGGRQTWNRW